MTAPSIKALASDKFIQQEIGNVIQREDTNEMKDNEDLTKRVKRRGRSETLCINL
jgi:hypothetical protein